MQQYIPVMLFVEDLHLHELDGGGEVWRLQILNIYVFEYFIVLLRLFCFGCNFPCSGWHKAVEYADALCIAARK